ncbi:FRG domain-containing protein [Rhizobium mongolense]|uniref:FRG domain-containing protein n=1 Tax=Rhizobium mongolense TaxID=57676 RepID=UPI003556AE01
MAHFEDILGEEKPHEFSAPTYETVKTLDAFASSVAKMTAEDGKLWFRGTRQEDHHLRPSLYRHPAVVAPDELIELEWELLSEFRHQAPPFAGKLPSEDLELLFLMQHYGVPTRLLDWTENPFIALFFALENSLMRGAEEHDAVVWVLNPLELNARATQHREASSRVFGAYSDELGGYQPSSMGKRVTMKLPLAIFGVHNSPRIVAQRGAFVLFGKNTEALDQHPALSGEDGVVLKIRIPGFAKKSMFLNLYDIGISDAVVYPDLDGLGREIKNRRGF